MITQDEFKKLWTREASEQFGLMLDVIELEGAAVSDNKKAA